MKLQQLSAVALLTGFLMGCDADATILPAPEALTDMASGVYCGMTLTEHSGPKAQVFEKGRDAALWFTAVRDALAYSVLPGEAQSVVAIYVHDMGQATSWENPQSDGIWILASTAVYVVGSNKRGGMGMTEVVPFASPTDAASFAQLYGGDVVAYKDIPEKFLFPEPEAENEAVASHTVERNTQ